MSVIRIDRFNGMAPSANPEYLNTDLAVLAKNVDVRFGDLRPAMAPSLVTTTTAGGTLYKFSGASTFITKPGDVNFVRGPIPNDTTERTYYTGDGPPKVTDLTLAVRSLGVPKPTVAPVVAEVSVASFTTEDAAAALSTADSIIYKTVRDNLTAGYYGLSDSDVFDLSPVAARPWEYSVVRAGATINGVFTPTASSDAVLISPELNYTTTANSILIPLFVRGARWTGNSSAMTIALAAIPSIDTTKPSEKMLTSDQVTAVVAEVNSALASNDKEITAILAKLKAEKLAFVALLNDPASVTAAISGIASKFYASSDGAAALSNAIRGAAERIVNFGEDNQANSTTVSQAEAAINARISTLPNGTKALDSSSLQTWIFPYTRGGGSEIKYDLASVYREVSNIALGLATELKKLAEQALGDLNKSTSPIAKILIDKQAAMAAMAKQIEVLNLDAASTKIEKTIKVYFNSKLMSSMPHGEASIISARAYIFTEVSNWGEESAPSPVSNIVELDQNDTATVTLPASLGGNFTKRRLYRSATGSSTSAFLFHSEVPSTTTVISDAILDEQLGEACATFGWDVPPTNLKGIVGMPNGIMLGFTGDTLHACEPYAPYAWPAKYSISLEYPIVGISVAGQTAIVTTTGVPYLVSGVDSSSLSADKLPVSQSCIAKRSMVAIGGGVMYASPDGLVLIDGGAAMVITDGLLSKGDWAAYNPSSMIAAEYEGRYCAFYTKSDNSKGCLVFDIVGKSLVDFSTGCDAVYTDKATDTMYTLSGTNIYNYFPVNGSASQYTWRSKLFMLPSYASFGWLSVDANFGSVTVKLYGAGTLFSTTVVTSSTPVRLPPGRFKDWQIEIIGNCRITRIVVATAISELQKV